MKTKRDGEVLAKKIGAIGFFESSAAKMEGIETVFNAVASYVVEGDTHVEDAKDKLKAKQKKKKKRNSKREAAAEAEQEEESDSDSEEEEKPVRGGHKR